MTEEEISKRQDNFFNICSKCETNYSCCHETLPPITRQRREIVEAYLKSNRISVRKPFCKKAYTFPRIGAGGYCVFHDRKTRKCLIHAVKPETCIAGPITFDINRKTESIEWFIKMEKICPLAGVVYRNKEQLRRHLDSAKKEITRLVQKLDSEDLKDVLMKDEPETFKIDEEAVGKDVLRKLCEN